MTEARIFNPEKFGSKETEVEVLKRKLANYHALIDDHYEGIEKMADDEVEETEVQIAKLEEQLRRLE